ncbi:hypothetical protein [Actinoalloteichus caeruleus]|uniref:hypothetical protein n=1 Tax=Actinoalloteichus cyanogriseus TaxID=2893586 RepID=UPI0004AA8F85|nr:hypothetical protein [Actinoalloteichus caeruleus]
MPEHDRVTAGQPPAFWRIDAKPPAGWLWWRHLVLGGYGEHLIGTTIHTLCGHPVVVGHDERPPEIPYQPCAHCAEIMKPDLFAALVVPGHTAAHLTSDRTDLDVRTACGIWTPAADTELVSLLTPGVEFCLACWLPRHEEAETW